MAMKISNLSGPIRAEVERATEPEVFDALQRLAFDMGARLKETFGDRFDRRKFLKDCKVDPINRPAVKTGLVTAQNVATSVQAKSTSSAHAPAANIATINGATFTFNINLPWASNLANALCFQHKEYKFTYERGRKYDKVWREHRVHGAKSIYCFVEKNHPQHWVLKPGSISGPQRDPETGEPARRYSMQTYAEFFAVVRKSDPHGSFLYKMTKGGTRRKPAIRRIK